MCCPLVFEFSVGIGGGLSYDWVRSPSFSLEVEIELFLCPGLKGPPWASSNRIVRLFVRNSVPLTKCNI